MKIKLLIPALAIITLFLGTACEKCMTCQYSYDRYKKGIWDNISHTEEFCGNTEEVEAQEKAFMEAAEQADLRNQSTPTCWYD